MAQREAEADSGQDAAGSADQSGWRKTERAEDAKYNNNNQPSTGEAKAGGGCEAAGWQEATQKLAGVDKNERQLADRMWKRRQQSEIQKLNKSWLLNLKISSKS